MTSKLRADLDKEAVLVEPPLTRDQAQDLALWIKSILRDDKALTTIFITHGHGDHYFSLGPLLQHFPNAHAVATPATIAHMAQQEAPERYGWWVAGFPNGQISKPTKGIVQPLSADNTIELEGYSLRVVEAGHSDTHDSSFLHVPSLDKVVAGDICCNELHQWLVEATTSEKRGAWVAALHKIAAVKPATVIASHKRPGAVDGINNMYSTVGYIETFGQFKAESKSAEELYKKMIERYPERINPIIL